MDSKEKIRECAISGDGVYIEKGGIFYASNQWWNVVRVKVDRVLSDLIVVEYFNPTGLFRTRGFGPKKLFYSEKNAKKYAKALQDRFEGQN